MLTVLSPHQDDAGLSLATTIRAMAQIGHAVRIVNCFTISEYAPHAEAYGKADVRQLRKDEDREFASRSGAHVEVIDLEMEDAPIRLNCPVSQARRRRVGSKELEDAARIAKAVGRIADGLVLVPLGLGRHIDHLVALEAGMQLAEAGGMVAFYEDLPYAADLRECCIVRAADAASFRTGGPLRGALVRDAEGAARKRFAIEAYRSQLSGGQFDAVIGYGERRGGAERIWMSSAAEEAMPAPVERAGVDAGSMAAAMRRRLQCAAHAAANGARAVGRHVAQLSRRGGEVSAPQAN